MASMATMKLGSKSEVFQRQGQIWNCTTGLPSDVVIQIGETTFNLHKFPLLSRSGTLEKMIGESQGTDGASCILQLHDLPGGTKAFELIAKFCYGVKLELNAFNVVCLRCAAEQLQMTEEYGEGNLILHTENFLNELFGNWKDSLKLLETCEEVLPLAEELRIVSRCINSLAVKALADPILFGWPMEEHESIKSPGSGNMWNGIGTESKSASVGEDWWYDDVSLLSLFMYKMFISAVESRGMNLERIAGSLMFYAKRHLTGLSRHSSAADGINQTMLDSSISSSIEGDQRVLLEEIVRLLPPKKGVTSAKLLLGLLRFAMILKASTSCKENLEKRVGAQLDEATLEDLLMPNLDYSGETLYDIDCVQRILDQFMLLDQSEVVSSPIVDEVHLTGASPSKGPLTTVATLVDGFLAEVAPDANMKFHKFQLLAAAIPDSARPIDDGLYRAIDIYLKAHPGLSELEREQLCHLMNCQKLSLEACTHAAQNERLPLRVIVQVLFFEQLRLRTSIAGWFFVSDNLENPRQSNLTLQKRRNGPLQREISQELKEDSPLSGDETRLKLSKLQKECNDMKMEIAKMVKSKRGWHIFAKKFGWKSISQPFCDGKDVPIDCLRDGRKKLF